MNPDASSNRDSSFTEESETLYTLEVIAELAGVDAQTVIRYQEKGFIQPVKSRERSDVVFDDECLRRLRRIEHLRDTCGMNEEGLRLLLSLAEEVESLRQQLRQGGG